MKRKSTPSGISKFVGLRDDKDPRSVVKELRRAFMTAVAQL
jgi:hypothetical protein